MSETRTTDTISPRDAPPELSADVRGATRHVDRAAIASRLHYASLVVAGVYLAWADRRQWFDSDEWAFLVHRRLGGGNGTLGLLAAHNEHWSTFAIVVYRILYTLFGVRTYAPYLALLILAHLAVVHMLWRVLRRMPVDPFLATGAAAIFAVLGIGWENLTAAFQFSYILPIAIGLGAFLLVDVPGPLKPARTAAVAGLLVFSLPWTGTSLTMLAVVAALALVQHGWRKAVVVAGPAVVVYAVWYVGEGRHATGAGHEPLGSAFTAMPAFVWRGLTGAVDGTVGFAGIGPAMLVLLGVFLARRAGRTPGVWPEATLLAGGAVLSLALVDIRRSGLGVETAASSRYLYIVVVLLLPAAVLALDAVLRPGPLRVPALVLIGVGMLGVQLTTLRGPARDWGDIEQEQKRRVVAAAQLLREHAPMLEGTPAPTYMPDLTLLDLARLDREGKLPGNITPSPRDLLTAAVWTQLHPDPVRPGAAAPVTLVTRRGVDVEPAGDCLRLSATGDAPRIKLHFAGDGAARLRSDRVVSLGAVFVDGGRRSGTRTLGLAGGSPVWLHVVRPVDLRLDLPPGSTIRLCDVARP